MYDIRESTDIVNTKVFNNVVNVAVGAAECLHSGARSGVRWFKTVCVGVSGKRSFLRLSFPVIQILKTIE